MSEPKEKIFISHGDLILDNIYDENLNLIKQDGGGCNWNDLYNLARNGRNLLCHWLLWKRQRRSNCAKFAKKIWYPNRAYFNRRKSNQYYEHHHS